MQSPKPILKTQSLKWVYAICSASLWQLWLDICSYRTKCELVIGIGQRSQVPCFNRTSLSYVMLQRCYLNTGVQHACVFLMSHLEHVEKSSFIVMTFDLLFSLLIRACLNDDTGVTFVGIVIFLWINRQYDFFHGESSQLKGRINPWGGTVFVRGT